MHKSKDMSRYNSAVLVKVWVQRYKYIFANTKMQNTRICAESALQIQKYNDVCKFKDTKMFAVIKEVIVELISSSRHLC